MLLDDDVVVPLELDELDVDVPLEDDVEPPKDDVPTVPASPLEESPLEEHPPIAVATLPEANAAKATKRTDHGTMTKV